MSTTETEQQGKLRINGKLYEIPSDYRLSEYKLLEEMTGKDAISEIDFTSSKAMAAITLILLRRENPDFDEAELDDVLIGFVTENGAEGDAVPPAKKTRPRVSGAQS